MDPFPNQNLSPVPNLLGNWSGAPSEEKEAAERKIKYLFRNNIKIIFIPSFHMSEEKRQELRRNVREWNRGHTMKGEDFENDPFSACTDSKT